MGFRVQLRNKQGALKKILQVSDVLAEKVSQASCIQYNGVWHIYAGAFNFREAEMLNLDVGYADDVREV